MAAASSSHSLPARLITCRRFGTLSASITAPGHGPLVVTNIDTPYVPSDSSGGSGDSSWAGALVLDRALVQPGSQLHVTGGRLGRRNPAPTPRLAVILAVPACHHPGDLHPPPTRRNRLHPGARRHAPVAAARPLARLPPHHAKLQRVVLRPPHAARRRRRGLRLAARQRLGAGDGAARAVRGCARGARGVGGVCCDGQLPGGRPAAANGGAQPDGAGLGAAQRHRQGAHQDHVVPGRRRGGRGRPRRVDGAAGVWQRQRDD